MAKLLFIESEPGLRRLYQEGLETEGYEVVVANGRNEALRQMEMQLFDIALVDTDVDGFECIQQMLERQHDLKIIISTACPSFEFDFKFWLADRIVLKPPDMVKMKEAVANLSEPPHSTPAGS